MFKTLYEEEADEMPSPILNAKKDKDSKGGPPPFLLSRSIKHLAKSNFSQVTGNKETAALVMFYDPECLFCQSAKPHFLKAAKTTHHKNRIYAAVDCTKEEVLCDMENVKNFPTFKLYVGGRFLAKYNQSPNFINMRNFLENAPMDTLVDDRSDLNLMSHKGGGKSDGKMSNSKKFKEDL